MDVGEETASAICSGNMDGTILTSRGWSMGRSSLPLRRDGSNFIVEGANGPSSVVGIRCSWGLTSTFFAGTPTNIKNRSSETRESRNRRMDMTTDDDLRIENQ